MADNLPFWQSPSLPQETPRDAAERFVLEAFGNHRKIIWGDGPGLFRFHDGYWWYRISANGGHWFVHRIADQTPQAKNRAKARRNAK